MAPIWPWVAVWWVVFVYICQSGCTCYLTFNRKRILWKKQQQASLEDAIWRLNSPVFRLRFNSCLTSEEGWQVYLLQQQVTNGVLTACLSQAVTAIWGIWLQLITVMAIRFSVELFFAKKIKGLIIFSLPAAFFIVQIMMLLECTMCSLRAGRS